MDFENGMKYDIFISHASEDKESIVRPLAHILESRGMKVWLDEEQITLGDSLRKNIENGLSKSRFGLVILSPAFFKKNWPQRELDALISRDVVEGKVILPVWHNINASEIRKISPLLADKVAISSSNGIMRVAEEIVRSIDASSLKVISIKDDNEIERKKKKFKKLLKYLPYGDKEKVNAQFNLKTREYKFQKSSDGRYGVVPYYGEEYIREQSYGNEIMNGISSDGLTGLFATDKLSPNILELEIDVLDITNSLHDSNRLLTIETYPLEIIPFIPLKAIFIDPGYWFKSIKKRYWLLTRVEEDRRPDYQKTRNSKEKEEVETICRLCFCIPKGKAFKKVKVQDILVSLNIEGESFYPIVQSWTIPSIWD